MTRASTLLLLALAMGACVHRAPERTGLHGSLVIMGGGIDRENEGIYQAIVERAGPAGIAIIPAASDDAQAAGASGIARFALHGGEAIVLDVSEASPERAHAPETVEAIRRSGGVYFSGGVQGRLMRVIGPDHVPTPALLAVHDLLALGGVVAGNSAGAAVLSDPMILAGSSAAALIAGASFETSAAEEPAHGVGIAPGTGLFPFALIDQHHIERGRTGRLLVALQATHQPFGFGVDENSALLVDRATARGEVLEGVAVLMADVSEMTGAPGEGFHGARISILRPGDRVDLRSGLIFPAADRVSVAPPSKRRIIRREVPDVWSDRRFAVAVEEMCTPGQSPIEIELCDARFTVMLTRDVRTVLLAAEGESQGTLLDLRLDIGVSPGAPPPPD
jgi:cyanophycinase